MARVKLALPDQFVFTTEIAVHISYINYGGHLGNDAVLSLLHEARVRFFHSLGYSELDIEGRGIVIADAIVVYLSEAFHEDLLVVSIAVTNFHAAGCDIYYQIVNKATGKEVARAKTGIVFFDYQARRPVRVPEAFRRRVLLESAEAGA